MNPRKMATARYAVIGAYRTKTACYGCSAIFQTRSRKHSAGGVRMSLQQALDTIDDRWSRPAMPDELHEANIRIDHLIMKAVSKYGRDCTLEAFVPREVYAVLMSYLHRTEDWESARGLSNLLLRGPLRTIPVYRLWHGNIPMREGYGYLVRQTPRA